jgi:hypothetical protein
VGLGRVVLVILGDVMQAIADRLDTIDGLRCFGYPQPAVTPPAAIVSYPEKIAFDQTYVRGKDRITLPLVVVVGKAHDRSTRDRVGVYCDGSGTSSVKAVLESGTYTAFDEVVVTDAEFDVVDIAGTDYLAALFNLDIVGAGA